MYSNMFRKKVDLTNEEIATYQKELLYHGAKEQADEAELESIEEKFKAEIKTKKSEIISSKMERQKYQTYLYNGYKFVEVPSVTFIDSDKNQEITIEKNNGELLERKSKSLYPMHELEFENNHVIVIDTNEKAAQTYEANPELYDLEPVIVDLEDYLYYYFSDEDDCRLLRFENEMTIEQFREVSQLEGMLDSAPQERMNIVYGNIYQ